MFRNLFNRLRGWVRVAVAILAVAAVIWGLGLLRGHKAAETAVAPAAEQKAESSSATPKANPAQPPAPKAEGEDMFVLPPSPKGPSPFESPNLKSAKKGAEKVRDGNPKIEAKRKALREELELDIEELERQIKRDKRNLKICKDIARKPAWSECVTRQAERDAESIMDRLESLEKKLEKKQKELQAL